MQYEFESLVISAVSLSFAFIGGLFALMQWRKSLIYKRTEIVSALIKSTRQDEAVATVMNIIDWNEDFTYDGKFHICGRSTRAKLNTISDEDLFSLIDHTLSIFSYICYLKSVGTIKNEDIRFFEYEIRRLIDNKHIRDYLYSLYHWSKKLSVKMSFSYLIEYGLQKKYLDKDFETYSETSRNYTCYLFV